MELWKHFIDWCRRPGIIKIQRSNPGIGMAALFRGAKAGAVSGVIYGAVTPLIINIGINLPYGHLGNWFAGIMMDGMWFLVCTAMSINSGAIFGVGFGLIFAALYGKLPGRTSAIKGIVISLIHWIVMSLGLQLLYGLPWYWFEGLHVFFNPHNFWMWGPIVIGLGTSIIWGWLLGHFWESEWLGKL